MKMKLSIIFLLSALVAIPMASFSQVQKASKSAKVKQETKEPASKGQVEAGKSDVAPAGKSVVKPFQFSKEWSVPAGELKFRELPYSYEMLEPVIDKLTVEIHYDRHHRAYYNNFMKAIAGTEISKMPLSKVFAGMTSFPEAVRNNGGGFFNHVLYWENMSPDGGGEPTGELAEKIAKTFGSYGDFISKFETAAKSHFGSGWAWLSADVKSGELFISTTPNQDNPLMNTVERRGIPLLALDVWEHAYYLNYQNKRADYISAFWKKVNWKEVENRYRQVQAKQLY